jgi:hypothetical protein
MTIVKIDHNGLTDLLNNGGFESGKMYGVVMETRDIVNRFTVNLLKRLDGCTSSETNILPIVFTDTNRDIAGDVLTDTISEMVIVNTQDRGQEQTIADVVIGTLERYKDHKAGQLVVVIESFFEPEGMEIEEWISQNREYRHRSFVDQIRTIREYGGPLGHVIIIELAYDDYGHELIKHGEPITTFGCKGAYKYSRRIDMELDTMFHTQAIGQSGTMAMGKSRGVEFDRNKVINVTDLLLEL